MRTPLWLIAFATLSTGLGLAAAPETSATNLLTNPSFEEGLSVDGIPSGWSKYGGLGADQRLSRVTLERGGVAVLIEDNDAAKPFGVAQTVSIEPGKVYTASVRVKAVAGGSPNAGTLVLRLGNMTAGVVQFGSAAADKLTEFSLVGRAPDNAKAATIYVYSRKQPNCKFLLESVRFVLGGNAAAIVKSGRREPGLEAQPPPVYAKLKELHLSTSLVRDGKPNAAIVTSSAGIYDDRAKEVAQAIKDLTNVELPIVDEAAVPITGNLVALGNRSTNKTIEELYNRYFTLLDLRYPGRGGHVVRTLHNPFGNGCNVILAGGSDLAGVRAATEQLIRRLKTVGRRGELTIGRLADIQLPPGLAIPTDMDGFPLWTESEGYSNSGVFGWTVLTKRAALHYLTGDPLHAREFLRLAFPDKKAVKEIRAIDKGKVDVTDPLTGLDHYRSHRMILYWDLIEESPVFTDEERLKVTNAFARQLKHRKKEGAYRYSGPSTKVSSRHGQWGAVCIYTICRYFARDYPEQVWKEGLQQAEWEFASLHRYDWVHGENDNLFWYTTSMEPLTCYLLLSGDRVPVENGVYKKLTTAQEALLPGIHSHRHIRYGALNWFHKVAYLLQDGRWVYYRDQTKLMEEPAPFRVGQSYWPEAHLAATPPDDRCGKWTVDFMPEARWKSLNNGFAQDETFTFASFRSQPDETGDYILIDGYNGQGRNPYHCFAILELRIAGRTVLNGYQNQVISKVDGMVEPAVAKYAALKRYGVLGETAFAVAEVPNHAYCKWRRTLAQRVGRYALVVDNLTFRVESENVEVQTKWWTPPHTWDSETNRLHIGTPTAGETTRPFSICPSDLVQPQVWKFLAILSRCAATREGDDIISFSLIAPRAGSACVRLSSNSAALTLPSPKPGADSETALAVAGEYDQTSADLAILARSHLHALQLTRIGAGQTMITADRAVDADWDFEAGTLHVNTLEDTRLALALAGDGTARLDGEPVRGASAANGLTTYLVPAGRHAIEGARPSPDVLGGMERRLAELLVKAESSRAEEARQIAADKQPDVPALEVSFSSQVDGKIVDLEIIESDPAALIAAAVGSTIHVLDQDGRVVRTLKTDADMRAVHWWKEAELLLTGCKDEKVIAFDLGSGDRRWVFESKMAPWVYTHQASHWWKEAGPHHAGIHGLTSGRFLDEPETQAIVGSACTVEVLDRNGKLLLRREQVWGDIVHMLILPRSDGSRSLLSMRRPSLTDRVNILNSRTLNPRVAGFFGVPPGHTNIQSWGRARYHLMAEDLDGDGTKEVIGEINGPWDRVGVWDESGAPKYNAPFGPGLRSSRSLRDLDVADLDGDGKKEILVATDARLLVALNCRCEKVWSKMLASPARALKPIRPRPDALPRIIVGCQDGQVLALGSDGNTIRRGEVDGRPDHIASLTKNGKPLVLLTTTKGQMKALNVPD